MSMSNGASMSNGEIVDLRPSSRPIPLFQDLEYKRSFLTTSPTRTLAIEMSYLKLLLAAAFEPIIYHPLIVISSLVGYYRYITRQKAVWVSMERTGMKHKKK